MSRGLSDSALTYTVQHLMRVAAPNCSYEISLQPDESAVEIHMNGGIYVSLRYLSQNRWPELLRGEFPTVSVKSFDEQVDVLLFPVDSVTEFARWEGARLLVHADVITLSFLLLSREEERLLPERDQYGRFLYAHSLAKRYGFVDIPIVDEWAMLLRKELLRIFNADQLGCHIPSIRLTHDMDTARRFPNARTAVKSILGGDLLLRKSPKIAWESFRQYLASRTHPERDPELLGAEKLLELSLKYGFHSEFYFMGLSAGEPDYRYEVTASAVSAFAKKAKAAGMDCGFHGSMLTPQDADRFSVEQHRVTSALGYLPTCGRQHYLCFDAEQTPEIWESAGIQRDSTLGFADREGFRCGTCHAFPLYDLVRERPLSVWEHPLIVMDGSMRGRGLDAKGALASLERLSARCYAVGGEFVLLWHNRSTGREWKDWFETVYLPFLAWASEQFRNGATT